jgi:hypothetical protein
VPVHHAPSELLLELGAVEAGVCGTFGGSGVLGCGDGLDVGEGGCRFFFALEADGLGGEAVPGGLAAARGMIDAADFRQYVGEGPVFGGLFAASDDLDGHFGEVAAPGGRAMLIAYDAEMFALAGEFEDGEEEVFTLSAVDPTGAEDQVAGTRGGEGLFAGEFAGSVDADRGRGVGLHVRCSAGAAEDVVGGEVNDTGSDRAGLFADGPGGFGVDGVGEVGLALGFVDCSVGAGVDDPSGLDGANGLANGLRVGEVHGGACGGDDFAQVGEETQEFAADLSGRSGEEDGGCSYFGGAHRMCAFPLSMVFQAGDDVVMNGALESLASGLPIIRHAVPASFRRVCTIHGGEFAEESVLGVIFLLDSPIGSEDNTSGAEFRTCHQADGTCHELFLTPISHLPFPQLGPLGQHFHNSLASRRLGA